ncbi:toll/interleukin-1 receptor domain-containing adapter protein isoform X2 [Carettochelys insculpta]|uniref:toll/interleukin-1 receptor domain-containing adapter protein isoform X2 n=1 Tax=Carettochelys insculpta TaxID=44489 RepID=UPI003EBF5DEA
MAPASQRHVSGPDPPDPPPEAGTPPSYRTGHGPPGAVPRRHPTRGGAGIGSLPAAPCSVRGGTGPGTGPDRAPLWPLPAARPGSAAPGQAEEAPPGGAGRAAGRSGVKTHMGTSHLTVTSDMAGWLRRLLQKPKPSASSPESGVSAVLKQPCSFSSSSSSSSSEMTASSSACRSVGSLGQLPSAPQVSISSSGSPRWAKSYDVCICHSEGDLEFAEEMVSYLESQPEDIRCFLQLRDAMPGGAITTELCHAVHNSHCWVLLITPSFLKDSWCRYQMHQALAEAPMANGRAIPVLKGIGRRDYPQELRCVYYISVTSQENGFRQIKDAVLHYLRELCQSTTSQTE